MTPLDAVLDRLATQLNLVPGVTIFAGSDPALPTTGSPFLTVFESGGRTPIGTHNEGFLALRQPHFQVVARAKLYQAASLLAQQAYTKMSLSSTLIGDVYFLLLRPQEEPFALPQDASGRVRMAFNVEALIRG